MKKKILSEKILTTVLIFLVLSMVIMSSAIPTIIAGSDRTIKITSIQPPPPEGKQGSVQIYDPETKQWETKTGKDLPIEVKDGGKVKADKNTTAEVTYKDPLEKKQNKYRVKPDREVTFKWRPGYWDGDLLGYIPPHWEVTDSKTEKYKAEAASTGLFVIGCYLGLVGGIFCGIAEVGFGWYRAIADSPIEVTVYNGSVGVFTTNVTTNETIGCQIINGSLWFDENNKTWFSSGQSVTVYDDGTISEPIEVLLDATGMGFTPYGSDSQGLPTAHYPDQDIYVSGYAALLPPNAAIPVYLMPELLELPDYYNPDLAIAGTVALTDNLGNLPETLLWKPDTSDIGLYNIWIDTDNSASYTEGDIINFFGVRVIPLPVELPTICFIATAAYGTPMAEEIEVLREFRDQYLLTNPFGEALVEFYYQISPPMAEFITEHPSLKPIVRAGLVPAVAMSTVAVNTTPAEKIAMVGLVVLVSMAVIIWATRRRRRGQEYT
jgi:hypothetical protein